MKSFWRAIMFAMPLPAVKNSRSTYVRGCFSRYLFGNISNACAKTLGNFLSTYMFVVLGVTIFDLLNVTGSSTKQRKFHSISMTSSFPARLLLPRARLLLFAGENARSRAGQGENVFSFSSRTQAIYLVGHDESFNFYITRENCSITNNVSQVSFYQSHHGSVGSGPTSRLFYIAFFCIRLSCRLIWYISTPD